MANTLGKSITAQFFQDENGWQALRDHWKTIHNTADSAQQLLYLVLIGRDWTKAFTPATNQTKLSHQYTDNPYYKVNNLPEGAVYALHNDTRMGVERLLKPFNGLITVEALALARTYVPRYLKVDPIKYEALKAEQQARVEARKAKAIETQRTRGLVTTSS